MRSAQRPRRLVRIAVAVLAAAVAGSALAQTPVPMRLYPLAAIQHTTPEVVADAQALLDVAAAGLSRRSHNLQPMAPLHVPLSCGPVPETHCLVRLAREGVIVWGAVHAGEGILTITLRAVDARGKVFGPVRGAVDMYIQSAEPFVRALLALDARVGLVPEDPTGKPRKALGEVMRGPAVRERMRGRVRAKAQAASGAWQRSAGKVLLVGGLALAGAGAGVALLDQRLSDSLEEKYNAGTLTPADADSYRRVDRYNRAATVLFAAGAVVATTGATIWILAPDSGGARVGVTGRF